jgi:hypothetical protein
MYITDVDVNISFYVVQIVSYIALKLLTESNAYANVKTSFYKNKKATHQKVHSSIDTP